MDGGSRGEKNAAVLAGQSPAVGRSVSWVYSRSPYGEREVEKAKDAREVEGQEEKSRDRTGNFSVTRKRDTNLDVSVE